MQTNPTSYPLTPVTQTPTARHKISNLPERAFFSPVYPAICGTAPSVTPGAAAIASDGSGVVHPGVDRLRQLWTARLPLGKHLGLARGVGELGKQYKGRARVFAESPSSPLSSTQAPSRTLQQASKLLTPPTSTSSSSSRPCFLPLHFRCRIR